MNDMNEHELENTEAAFSCPVPSNSCSFMSPAALAQQGGDLSVLQLLVVREY